MTKRDEEIERKQKAIDLAMETNAHISRALDSLRQENMELRRCMEQAERESRTLRAVTPQMATDEAVDKAMRRLYDLIGQALDTP